MILGQPTKLSSQFRLTYNMILNLLRVEALKVEEMIKRSFSEHATQSLLPDQQKQIAATEETLKKFEREPCSYCSVDLETLHSASMAVMSLGAAMLKRAMKTPMGQRLLSPGRLVIVHKDVKKFKYTLTIEINSSTSYYYGSRNQRIFQRCETEFC